MRAKTLVWFRQDLRLSDNLALHTAVQNGHVLAVYILDEAHADDAQLGAASRVWLHHSLHSLNQQLGGKLHCYQGNAASIIQSLIKRHQLNAVYWNRCYEPWRIAYDGALKKELRDVGVECKSFNASLLWEPWQILKSDGSSYKVFTPFYQKGCLNAESPRMPLPEPEQLSLIADQEAALSIDQLGLLPKIAWDHKIKSHWAIGEKAAYARLQEFIQQSLKNYKEGRNYPSYENVSRLSPYLHFGEISPYQIWHAVQSQAANSEIAISDTEHFLRELIWREFSYYLLYHFPELPHANWQKKFDGFRWNNNEKLLQAWQTGQTGYPIIDAGMRELWETGYMHNRVRMIVASFLVKNLLIDWRKGAAWFWDCLFDADLANNSASWQWVAGCGADAAPYFRIFNPLLQSEKFDPEGEYVRRYVPELARLPTPYLHFPSKAPEAVLARSEVILGNTYPMPIVELNSSRDAALQAFKNLS